MLLPLLLSTSQLLDQLSPLRPCLDSTLLEEAELSLLQMFVEDQHLGDHFTALVSIYANKDLSRLKRWSIARPPALIKHCKSGPTAPLVTGRTQ